mmetsp:Transcript_18751/g.61329  ORF Transcript_18751/g.61329 Transcript_18751/m.61329 type:complete len:218 (+) Transcript_18751:1024-1677(+)|eukprot:scaffold33229_cov112-Isochrysis_galbana.AAC.4
MSESPRQRRDTSRRVAETAAKPSEETSARRTPSLGVAARPASDHACSNASFGASPTSPRSFASSAAQEKASCTPRAAGSSTIISDGGTSSGAGAQTTGGSASMLAAGGATGSGASAAAEVAAGQPASSSATSDASVGATSSHGAVLATSVPAPALASSAAGAAPNALCWCSRHASALLTAFARLGPAYRTYFFPAFDVCSTAVQPGGRASTCRSRLR